MSKRLLISMMAMLVAIGVSCYSLTTSLQRNATCGWIALPAAGSGMPPVAPAQIKGLAFSLKVADNEQTRHAGLGGVAEIPADGGMIFVYPEDDQRRFWMEDCLTDMDIAFIDGRGLVVNFCTMLKESPRQPGEGDQEYHNRLHVYESRGLARYAVEVKAGTWSRLGLNIGDRLEIRQAPAK